MISLSEPLRKYVLHSTILMLFAESFFWSGPIDFKLFYFVLMVNLLLLLSRWPFTLPGAYAIAIIGLWFFGWLGIARGTDTLSAFAQQGVGITACSFYFLLFFRQEGLTLRRAFQAYASVAFWVCVLGLAISAISSLITGQFVPVQSIFLEPAHFATALLPAMYHLCSQAIRREAGPGKAVLVVLALALSGSASGYVGMFVAGLLLARRRPVMLLVTAMTLTCLGTALYLTSAHFRIRIDDTFSAGHNSDVSGANLSTFALLSNAYVAQRAYQEHPYIGFGPGGHQIAHDRYISDLPGLIGSLAQYAEINKRDANSMFLRITSEFGILGWIVTAAFLIKFRPSRSSFDAEIGCAVLAYFAAKLLREGHWFTAEFYFFMWSYVLASGGRRKKQVEREAQKRISDRRVRISSVRQRFHEKKLVAVSH